MFPCSERRIVECLYVSYNRRSVRKSWTKGDDKWSSVRVVLWPWFKSFMTWDGAYAADVFFKKAETVSS